MTIFSYKYDLPSALQFDNEIAVDTEAMGLNNIRDRLCVVQIGNNAGDAYVVHFPTANYEAPNLKSLLTRHDINKIFHFGRFDIAIIQHYLKLKLSNVFCTKIASKLSRTYGDSHSLRELCAALLHVKLSKQQQSSDWGAHELTQEQIEYAASDVMYLHRLKEILTKMLVREGRMALAEKCFDFLPTRAALDLIGWNEIDIFAH